MRAGHTEASVDLMKSAGIYPAGVICEIMNEDGTMARRADLEEFAAEHGIKIGTIADLIHYRVLNESTIEKIKAGAVQTDYGEFQLHCYRDLLQGDVHFALVRGPIERDRPTLVRVHVASALRDLLGTQPPNAPLGWNVRRCLERVAREGGVLVLLAGGETPADLLDSVEIAMGEMSAPVPTADGSHNAYMTVGLGSQILRDVGVGQIRLMGAPIKYNAISGFDLEVVEFVKPEAAE